MIVSISGIDCSGKSTQIELLVREWRARGYRVGTFWHRPGYSRELDLLRRWGRQFRPGALPKSDAPAAREHAFSRPGIRRLWVWIALVDLIFQYAVKVRLRRAFERVVCDRYVDDAMLDLDLGFPELAPSRSLLARLARALAPRPDVSVLLVLPWAEVEHRAAQKREPFPDPPERRRLRYDAYTAMARAGKFTTIDGLGTVEGVAALVRASAERAAVAGGTA